MFRQMCKASRQVATQGRMRTNQAPPPGTWASLRQRAHEALQAADGQAQLVDEAGGAALPALPALGAALGPAKGFHQDVVQGLAAWQWNGRK